MLKRIVIISLFLFFPLSSYASDNRLLDGFDKWEAEQDKKATTTQPSKVSQDDGQPILYRNDQHHFRIKFPAGWEIKDGDGQHVVKKAVNDGGTVLILVREVSDFLDETGKDPLSSNDFADFNSAEFNDFSDEESNEFLETVVTGQLESFPGSTIIENGIRYIDNRKAIYIKMNQVYKVQNIQVEGVSINYFTIHKGKLYQIGGFYPTIPINESNKEPIINASLMTFVFEDWDNPADTINENSANSVNNVFKSAYDKDISGWGMILSIVVSILFTWGFGLLIPVLMRFVLIKRPLSQAEAALTSFIVYFLQLVTNILLGGGNNNLAITVVALVSYRIMRSGSRKENLLKFCKECGARINVPNTVCSKCRRDTSDTKKFNFLRAFLLWTVALSSLLIILFSSELKDDIAMTVSVSIFIAFLISIVITYIHKWIFEK
jgi:hypothetical protein